MKNTLTIGIGMSLMAATAAQAGAPVLDVPEINALAGVSAVAALAGGVALLRERLRRK